MIKKYLKNAGLLCIIACVFFSCDFKSAEEKRELAISFFIMDMADDYDSYKSLNFTKIDAEFLESQMPIYEAFQIVQDTTRRRFKLAEHHNLNVESHPKPSYRIDEVDEILLVNAQLDRALSERGFELPKSFKEKESKAMDRLNELLSFYNLSIYGIDLNSEKKSMYYHKFEISGGKREAIFEIDHTTEAILSYKELS